MNCPHCNVTNPDDARFCAACGKATSATEPVSHPNLKAIEMVGKEIAGRYRVLAKLGEGGMGAVYKAEQISLKRTCAVKLLRAEVASTELMLRRFDAEAKAVASLSHPNTVNIYDFGQDTDGTFFIAMEFVEGRSLREVIQTESPLPIRRALAIAAQVAQSLADAHSHNIIHRDLKPDNVMLQTRGRQKDVARVLDFGIAKLRDEGRATQAAMTQAGDMLGTPQYMAPEQIRADQIDGRTDVYALGCMLYEMLTGRMPFEGATVLAILSKHLTETPVPPSQRRPDLQIPPQIDQLVMSAVAKDREHRPATMDLFGEQISALLAQYPAETGQGTAQVSTPMSAVYQAASAPVGPTMATGPNLAAYGAAPVQPSAAYPPVAPPSPYVPAAAPPGPPPLGPAPGFGTPVPQPSPAYNPYPAAPPPVIAEPTPAGGKSKLWIAAIGAIVLIGGGIGIFVATRKGSAPVVATADAGEAPPPDKPDKPADPPPDKPDKPADPPPDKPDKPVDPPPVDDPPPDKPDKPVKPPPTNNGGDDDDADPWAEDDSAGAAPKPKPQGRPANVNAELDVLSNRACACSDATCGRRVVVDLMALAQRWKDKVPPNLDEARAKSSIERMFKCLLGAGVPQQELAAAAQLMMSM